MSKYKSDHQSLHISNLLIQIESKKKRGRIELNPKYQRDIVWTTDKKSNFINSCIIGIVPNSIIFNKEKNGTLTCIDGKQRLTSILKFCNNEISVNVDGTYYRYSKGLKILPDELREIFDDHKLNIIQYNKLTYVDQMMIFSRLQNGVALQPGEIIPVLFNDEKISDVFIKYANTTPSLFTKFKKINIKRKGHYILLIEIMFLIENSYVPTKFQREYYIKKITLKQLNTIIKIAGPIIIIYFSKILSSNKISVKIKKLIYLYSFLAFYNYQKIKNKKLKMEKVIQLLALTYEYHTKLTPTIKNNKIIYDYFYRGIIKIHK